MIDLLRRAWDALDSFKQTYPENWHEDDEQVMVDLMRADMKFSGVQRTWVGLTEDERTAIRAGVQTYLDMTQYEYGKAVQQATELKLQEKNS